MGLPVICNVGGVRLGSSAAVLSGPAISCIGGRLPVFVVLLINDACELFLPSPLSSILFPGSMAARSFPFWSSLFFLLVATCYRQRYCFFVGKSVDKTSPNDFVTQWTSLMTVSTH